MRAQWYEAADVAAQKRLTDAIHQAVWAEVPYIPLGRVFQPIAIGDGVADIIESPFLILWNARKA